MIYIHKVCESVILCVQFMVGPLGTRPTLCALPMDLLLLLQPCMLPGSDPVLYGLTDHPTIINRYHPLNLMYQSYWDHCNHTWK